MFFSCAKSITKVCLLGAVLLLVACSSNRRLANIKYGAVKADISVPSDEEFKKAKQEAVEERLSDTLHLESSGEPIIMNAIKDEETGEMVATDVISASKVVARFRNVAERFGKVSIEFDIIVPEDMMESSWKLEFSPIMKIMGDSTALEPVYITGRKYRDEQMRGYNRYNRFINSIISDSSYFMYLGQLEVFIQRHYPETYKMKTDSAFVSEPEAENLFGVSMREVLQHYTKTWLVNRNKRKIENKGKMFGKYVRDPLVSTGIRLDTVITSFNGDFIYRYVQEVNSRPGLKRIDVSLRGGLYNDGKLICKTAPPEDLNFYISSLSSLADMTPRYVTEIIERRVYDNTYAFIDFEQGKAEIDTTLFTNAEELARIRKVVLDVVSREELILDSLAVTASCSPEGDYKSNSRLAASRAQSVTKYLKGVLDKENALKLRSLCVPENWEMLEKIVQNDSVLTPAAKLKVAETAALQDKDMAEMILSQMPEYKYLREKIYPRLRSVRFDFYLHRAGMVKDTVHTTQIDSVYLAGVEAIRNLDYQQAVELLRPYHDYNTALAYLSAGYNHSALNDLENLKVSSARTDYLLAVVLSRLGRAREALEAYQRSVEQDPAMVFRANLDPELSEFLFNN